MWISRKSYDDLRLDAEKCRTEARVLSEQNRALQTTIDWFRVRISQLEMERAQMLYNYTGVKISTPSIEPAPSQDITRLLQAMPGFGDVGDREAAKLGVGWDDDGTLKTLER